MSNTADRPKIGIALGSGASRGWSHIGVLKALLDAGIEPDIVCGTSVGAMVGGSFVAGNLDKLERWVLSSSRSDVLRFFSFNLGSSAFIDKERLNGFLHEFVAGEDVAIEDLSRPFTAVCADLKTGREVLLTDGLLADAVRASMAMPGLFPAERNGERWLVDGGLVNPVPVSACRDLGADIVIGVNLNADILGGRKTKNISGAKPEDESTITSLKRHAKEYVPSLFLGDDDPDKIPGLLETISNTINIFQDQITRARLEEAPADVLIAPKVSNIGMFSFQRAGDAIKEGESCVHDALPKIQELLK